MLIHNANVTGSMHLNGMDMSNLTGSVSSITFNQYTSSTNEFTGSTNTRIANLDSTSGSLSTRVTSLESFSASLDATFATDAQLTSLSSSVTQRLVGDESTITSNSSSFASRLTTDESNISSLQTASGSFSTRTTSNESNISGLQTASGSFSTRTTNLETASGSFSTRVTNNESNISSLQTASGSFSTRTTNNESSLTSLNSKSGSFATTGSNTFNGTQTVTGSLFITENLTVLGSSSISYVSQSNLNIGTNLITVNAQNPSVRFGGLAVIDSGSVPQVSGSWLFDSIQNRWIMIHEQAEGNALTSSIALMGPETYNNLGSETTITSNRLIKGYPGVSGEHVGDSQISDDGTTVSIPGRLVVTGSITGSLDGSNITNSSISNAKLANSSVTVTAGSGLSGGGSVALGSSITLTNTITNNNQLTNGAGYITGIDSSAVTTALGYTPVTNARTLTINGTTYDLSANRTWSIEAGVSSFNTRTGAITLTSGDVTGALGYTPVTNARTLTINGTAYDLSADRSWTIAAGVSSITAGTGIAVSGTGNITVTNTGLLSATAGTGIAVSTSSGALTVTNTGILSGVAGTGIAVSTLSGALTITNTGLLSGTAGTGIAVSTSSGALTITNTGLLSGVAGTGIAVSTSSGALTITNTGVTSLTAGSGISISASTGGVTITNTITNNNQLTNGAGYITGITSGNVTTALGYTPYNSSNPSGYITGINSSMVTTALGYTPYNSSNPNGYITSSGTATNLSGAGASYIQRTSTGTSYSAAYQIRETSGYGGNTNISYSPLLGFHWSGVVASSIRMNASGEIQIVDNPGTSYEAFRASIVYGNSSSRSPIFYDLDDTGYYLDPASTSVMLATYIGGHYYYTYNSNNVMIRTAANGSDAGIVVQNSGGTFKFQIYGNGSDYGFLNGTWAGWDIRKTATGNLYLNGQSTYYYGSDVTYVYRVYGTADMRSPIYYDLDNTGYYLDPASTSNLNILNTAGVIQGGSYFRNNGVTTNVVYYASTSETFGNILGGVGGSTRSAFFRADSTTSGASVWWGRKDGSGNNVPGGAIDNTDGEFTHWINSGGTTGSWTKIFTVNSTGIQVNSGDLRAPIFYDSDNTSYYLNPASTSALNILNIGTGSGGNQRIQFYAGNDSSSYSALRFVYDGTERQQIHFFAPAWQGGTLTSSSSGAINLAGYNGVTFGDWNNIAGYVNNSGLAQFNESVRGPIFYDSNDTGYYLDPNSTSNIYRLTMNERITLGAFPNSTSNSGAAWIGRAADRNNGTMTVQLGGGSATDRRFEVVDYAWSTVLFNANSDGNVFANSSFRAPIFYDSNNTGYYVDPASNSSLNTLQMAGSISTPAGTAIYIGSQNVSTSSRLIINWHTDSDYNYVIGKRAGGWTQPMDIAFYTGIKYHAHQTYGGHKFYVTGYDGTEAFSIGAGDNNVRVGYNLYTPIMYDSDNTGYYANPASTSVFNVLQFGTSTNSGRFDGESTWGVRFRTDSGYIWFGPANSGHAHIYTDRSNFYFNAQLTVNDGSQINTGDIRSAIFYDKDDTGYYADFNSTSNSAMRVRGGALFGPNTTWGAYLRIGSNGNTDTGHASVVATNGNLHMDPSSGNHMYLNYYVNGYIYLNGASYYISTNGSYYNGTSASSNALAGYDSSSYLNKNATSYYQVNTWLQMNGTHGLYWPSYNGAHIYANTSTSYGSIRIDGSRSSWRGITFDASVTLMMNDNESGHYKDGYGWQYRWYNGSMYISTSAYGGGTEYTIVHTGNIASYTAGNVNSISSAVGGGYTWTGINYFNTNNGGYAGSTNSAKLQAYSDSNNSAFMSFHKGGHYAVNMGLDADNVMRIGGWSAAANRWQLDMSGNMTVAGDVTAYSDARVKTNVNTIENALEKTLALRGVTYNRTDSEDVRTKVGVIAQEIIEVLPEVVNQDNDGMYNVSYGNITALLIEAIKEQQSQIEELKTIINGLTK